MNKKYCVVNISDEEIAVVTEDYRVAMLRVQPHGGSSVTEYFERKLDLENSECIDRVPYYLGDGDSYYSYFDGEDIGSEERIRDALCWIYDDEKGEFVSVPPFVDRQLFMVGEDIESNKKSYTIYTQEKVVVSVRAVYEVTSDLSESEIVKAIGEGRNIGQQTVESSDDFGENAPLKIKVLEIVKD